ncbi:MAG: sulfurtransferase TusA family protein [Burkholderiales bacterium]
MAKAKRLKPQVTLDLRGTACPGPMLGAKRVLEELFAGEMMLLVSDCPATKDDLYSWPKYADVEIVKTQKFPRGGTGYYIRKGKRRKIAPNAVLDMRGSTCPGPIVEAKKLLNGMRKGEVLQLVSDCPGIRADLRSWVKATGMELADARERAPGEYQFQIRKR